MTMTATFTIPNKSSFKLDEVCQLTGVKPYILRFWESEFDEIQPLISASGQKIYEHKDITNIVRIRELLVDQKFSIKKAKKSLSQAPSEHINSPPSSKKTLPPSGGQLLLVKEKLQDVISRSQAIQGLLNRTQ